MKIEYKILWLDDQMKQFIDDEVITEIENHLIDEGITPVIVAVSKIDKFFEHLDDSYDLILTDYHMKDMNGDKVVEEIRSPDRDHAIFTEILFYTAQADLKDTHKISRVSFLETNGKPGSHQEILIKEIKNLINLTIKKFQNIVVMRGMIMHETSELDLQMLEIIEVSFDKANFDFENLAAGIYEQLNTLFNEKNKLVNQCRTNLKFKKLTKDNFVFSAKYKIQTLGLILNALKLNDFSIDYNKEINNVRNNFAHVKLEKDPETGKEFFKSSINLMFDENYCKKIRKDIIKHKINLDKLKWELASM